MAARLGSVPYSMSDRSSEGASHSVRGGDSMGGGVSVDGSRSIARARLSDRALGRRED